MLLSYLYIGIKADAAGIGIPESDIIVSLVLEQSGTGQGPLIQLPDWFRHVLHLGTGLADAGQSGIPAFTKAVQSCTPCCRKTSILVVEKRHPARRHCWWWKDNLHIHNACGGMTPCKSILLVVERHAESKIKSCYGARNLFQDSSLELSSQAGWQAGATTLCLLGP